MTSPTITIIGTQVIAIAYEADVPAQIAALQARVRSGDITGDHVGHPDGQLVAVCDAADMDTDGTIYNVPVDAGNIYLAQGKPGDADFTGAVNAEDFLGWNFGANGGSAHVPNWATGDFDSSGATNMVDFALWTGNAS